MEMEVPSGLVQRQVAYVGAVPDEVTVSAAADSGTVCLTDLVVGGPVTLPDAE